MTSKKKKLAKGAVSYQPAERTRQIVSIIGSYYVSRGQMCAFLKTYANKHSYTSGKTD